MRLEPVYLLAPKPKPPSIPTRRAFLIAGGTLLAGLGVGAATGYAAAASATGIHDKDKDPRDAAAADQLPHPEDLTLDQLRQLATDAPIEDLMHQSILFLTLLRDTYPDDTVLWHGAERIATELCGNSDLDNRRILARWLAQIAEHSDAHAAAPVRALAAQLRSIR